MGSLSVDPWYGIKLPKMHVYVYVTSTFSIYRDGFSPIPSSTAHLNKFEILRDMPGKVLGGGIPLSRSLVRYKVAKNAGMCM